MDDELFKLCKEVYERTGWGNYWEPDAGIYDYRQDKRKKLDLTIASYSELDRDKDAGVFFEGGYPTWIAPLYTSDYLLEKLPGALQPGNEPNWLTLMKYFKDTPPYFIGYVNDDGETLEGLGVSAATPLKALLKLVIALDDAGVKL